MYTTHTLYYTYMYTTAVRWLGFYSNKNNQYGSISIWINTSQ